jgi:hypothetical protein
MLSSKRWAWDEQKWITVARDAGRGSELGYRGLVVAFANLLGHRRLHHQVNVLLVPVAELVFGHDAVHGAITEVIDTLRSWDASRHTVAGHIPAALSDLLVTGTARLADIKEQGLRALAEQYPPGGRRSGLFKVSRVFAHQGVIARPLTNTDPQRGHGRTRCPRCRRVGWPGRSAGGRCPRTSPPRSVGCSR